MQFGLNFFFFLMLASPVWAGAVRLVNDTSYKLRAVVRAADGTYLGEVVVMPQQTTQWSNYLGGVGNHNGSQTPYMVAWYCMDGGGFSVCNNVPNAATITAFSCNGGHLCRPPKDQQTTPTEDDPTAEYTNEPNQQDQTRFNPKK